MHRQIARLLSVAAAPALALALAAPGAAAPARFPDLVPLPDASSPEGISAGPGSSFFAGSLADGSIYRGDVRTGRGAVLVPGEPGGSAVGLQFHKPTGLLWVAGGTTGTVTAYDASTGERVVRYQVPAGAAPRFLNDVEVTTDGVYVTDSRNAELVVLRTPDRDVPSEVELLPLTGDFVQGPGFGANGIRSLPGGDVLIVSAGELLRVDVQTGVADRFEQTGGEDLTSGDGLQLRGDTLYVVYGFMRDSVAVVDLDVAAGSYAVTGELQDDDLERPTTGVLTAGSLYVVNGKFNTVPTPTTFEVVEVAIDG